MQTNGSPSVVEPHVFAHRMQHHWVTRLGNESSPKLLDAWRVMGREFEAAIMDGLSMSSARKQWRILQPPTGSGKTQGAALYCSLVASNNTHHEHPVGVLLVVRLIEQCIDMVATINELAGRDVAFAHHSELPLSLHAMSKADILVITQAALVKAFEGLTKCTRTRWSHFADWQHGKRNLIIIDESLSGVVEENTVTLEGLRMALAAIPERTRKVHAEAFGALQGLESMIANMAKDEGGRDRFVWAIGPAQIDLAPLRRAIGSLPFDTMWIDKESEMDRRLIKGNVDAVLGNAQAVLERWAVYSKKGNFHTVNSALLLIPTDAPPAVVLDATASQSELWEVLGDRANISPAPSGARNYRNVTLHLCRAKAMGKHKMKALASERFPRLLANLEERLEANRKVFVCTHKAAEPTALSFELTVARYSVGHWGAIDGRNDWQEFDTAVIFGLPYRDMTWANNLFFAVHGPKENEWFDAPKWRGHEDVRLMMQKRQLSVSVIQAINRVRCRRVINDQGDCQPTDVFIVLPPDAIGDAILEAIRSEMPNIKVADWEFEPDGPQAKVRRGSSHEAVLSFMSQRLPGETPLSLIKTELGLTDRTVKELRMSLRDDGHPFTNELRNQNVHYQVVGQGRGSKSYLVKAA